MRRNLLLFLVAALCVFAFTDPALSQIATRSGTIYGRVVDQQGAPLPGVVVTLEGTVQPQTATTGPSGGFRFANLPPGVYSATFSIEGFAEVRQEDVRVSVGGAVELTIRMRPALAEQFVVVAETPVVDTRKTGNDTTFNREYLEEIPSGRDPWVLIEQTPGVDNDRINIAGSESGQQTSFFARGSSDSYNAWNYDGVNATDPIAVGASPTYYDFDAFEEIQIQSGGADASIGASGVVVNLVTKRPGNKWEANASYYITNESLQSDNTPDEVLALPPIAGQQRQLSNRIDQVYDYGFDIGGPIVKDKLFVWGAYRRNQIDLFTRNVDPFTGLSVADKTKLEDINFKVNFNANAANESQFGYFDGAKEKEGRGFNPPLQAPETLWNQGSPESILEGIITAQHTWIPNDHTIVNARYGYIGLSFELRPAGGDCPVGGPCSLPIVFLAATSRYENTSFNVSPIDRPSHDFNVDFNYFREQTLGGDHEFKFGFEYKKSTGRTFSSYGNGLYLYDYYSTTPAVLSQGFGLAAKFVDGEVQYATTSFYATDTFRADRLTLNLGFRVDSASGQNEPGLIPSIPGFESIVGPIDFQGNDRSPRFTDISPRLGATYDLTGDGKTVVRGNLARYYNGYGPAIDIYANPAYTYGGAIFLYDNLNGDNTVTPDEFTFCCAYYGGISAVFSQEAFDASKLIADDLDSEIVDEVVVGFEREVVRDLSLGVTYTYRSYKNFQAALPFGITADDFIPEGVFTANTVLGNFSVPYSRLDPALGYDGTQILRNLEDYSQTYNGVDFVARKRMSNNFMMQASVTLQRQKANLDGPEAFLAAGSPFQGDGIPGLTYIDPLHIDFYDDEGYAYVSGGSGKTGVFPYAEWTARMSGVYQLPWDASIGAFIRYQQGFPQPLFGTVSGANNPLNAFYGTNTRQILLEPIGDRRYENIFTLDLNFRKSFDLGDAGRITGQVDFFNLTNSAAVVQRERRVTASTFNRLQENLSPRAVRLGVKYSF